MGKRSRKRPSDGARPSEGATRAERDAARRERARQARAGAADTPAKPPRPRSGRPSLEERPPPLWHPFPLTELIILAGIVLMAWGFLSGADGSRKIAAGLAVASIAGLELSIREHVTGFRSHTTLLAAAVGIAVIVALGIGIGVKILGVLLLSGALAFAAAFYGLRELFKRRSGGLSFR